MMKTISAQNIRETVTYSEMIEALREGFRQDIKTPLRHQHQMDKANGEEDILLLMPAWASKGFGGIKIVNVVPGNSARNMPAVAASYLLYSMETGEHVALIDGAEITSFRTACASALAADYLARKDATKLLVVGAGQVGSRIPHAYKAIRPIDKVWIWDINEASARALVERLKSEGMDAEYAKNLEHVARDVDVITCATLARSPIIFGSWLQPGQHLDLIGSFTPEMREADDDAIRKASVHIDTSAALEESGDLVSPLISGALRKEDIAGDLFNLCLNETAGRKSEAEITLFKAVGTALEDLTAAELIYRKNT